MSAQTSTYDRRRQSLEEYFDRTAVETWAKLTSDAPVGRIRATVRQGRDRMRATLLGYLPDDLSGQRVLDAGCGTGTLAVEAARRGAHVVAIDHSPTLVSIGEERLRGTEAPGTLDLRAGDMLDPSLGEFDWVVAMDSVIHYEPEDMVRMIASLFARARRGMVLTFAPRTPLTAAMHLVGQAFPRGQKSPDIVPIAEGDLVSRLSRERAMGGFAVGRTQRIDVGFYISQALELARR